MTNRRQFIEGSVLLAAATLSAGHSTFAGTAARKAGTPRSPERFVFDTRFAASVEAAELARRQGLRLAETSGDVTRLWYDDLDLAWRRAPMTLAGVTTASALFVLETLAMDHGMRVIRRSEYSAANAEPLVAWTIAPRAVAPAV